MMWNTQQRCGGGAGDGDGGFGLRVSFDSGDNALSLDGIDDGWRSSGSGPGTSPLDALKG